ncbi:MAG: NAD-dependent epimerase/dehydratase family protein [Deltaproteobacteria bacterium]|nr:NAD-dependent epimerase/dehydratase family protein [Deltaproteobacteria bacterium]
MKCVVLGGGGFIGSHVCDAMLAAGHAVRVFERPGGSLRNIDHLGGRIECVEGDFLDPDDIGRAVAGQDVVVHGICTTLPKASNDDPAFDVRSNVIPTLQLLDAARSRGVRRVLFLSSGGTVYGPPRTTPIPEDHPNDPTCSYGIQKLAIEKYCALYHHLHGLDYRVLRVSNPYGERQLPHASQGAVAVFMNRGLSGDPIEIWGDGSVTRDYLHVSDVASAVVRAATHEGPSRIFNVGTGKGLSLLQLIAAIETAIGRPMTVRFSAARSFDVPVNVLDVTRARTELGWEPAVGLAEGLARTAASLRPPGGGAPRSG